MHGTTNLSHTNQPVHFASRATFSPDRALSVTLVCCLLNCSFASDQLRSPRTCWRDAAVCETTSTCDLPFQATLFSLLLNSSLLRTFPRYVQSTVWHSLTLVLGFFGHPSISDNRSPLISRCYPHPPPSSPLQLRQASLIARADSGWNPRQDRRFTSSCDLEVGSWWTTTLILRDTVLS